MKNGVKMEEEKIAEIANLCLKKYKESGKQGKPRDGQWTVLAGVVMEYENKLELISLATGTKCLSGLERINAKLPGVLLNDSHAEVLARRGLIYWLQSEILRCLVNKDESTYMNCSDKGKISLKPGLKLHMYSSYPPCGDATIFTIKSQLRSNEDLGLPIEDVNKDSNENTKVEDNTEDECENNTPPAKKPKQSCDIDLNRTGAKCVEGGCEDPRGEGRDYHSLGQIRTKPGRGDRTLSLSCSDKILKWNILGIQGSQLSLILEDPVYLTSIIIGSSSFNLESCDRAFNTRYISSHTHNILVYNYTEAEFEDQKNIDKVPSPDSSLLITGNQGFRETYVAGLRQGWSKKKLDNPKSWSSVCQRKLALRTLDILEKIRLTNTTITTCDDKISSAMKYKISCDKDNKISSDKMDKISCDIEDKIKCDKEDKIKYDEDYNISNFNKDEISINKNDEISYDTDNRIYPTTYLSLKNLPNDYNESKRKFKSEMKTWPIKNESLYEFIFTES